MALDPTLFFPYVYLDDVVLYDKNLDDCKECLALYEDLVRADPELAISWMDLFATGPSAAGYPDTTEMVTNVNSIANEDRPLDSTTEEANPSTSSAQPTPLTSGSHVCRRYNYSCEVCGRPQDRAERARDCANRDRGLTPHAFLSGTSVDGSDSTKAYSSEALLREHLAPPEDRDVQCPKWFVVDLSSFEFVF